MKLWNAGDLRVEDARSRRGGGHLPRPQTEKDTTSTGSFAQAFLRKAEIPRGEKTVTLGDYCGDL